MTVMTNTLNLLCCLSGERNAVGTLKLDTPLIDLVYKKITSVLQMLFISS